MTDEYIKREDAIKPFEVDNQHLYYPFEVTNRLRAVPAADVAPVRHGRWIKSPECPEQYDICSVCGKNDKHRCRGDADHPALESIPPFCKWCGAKLDKEDQNA